MTVNTQPTFTPPTPGPSEAADPGMWERWKDLAARAAAFQARVLLVIFYWICVTPFAIVVRLLSDPLGYNHERGGNWEKMPTFNAENQF